ncbi:MAG: response regulator [Pseudomonadota bacterium]
MELVFRPALALMNRLRYAHKFMLLGLLTLVAIGALQLSLFNALDRVIGPSVMELKGLASVMRLHRMIQLVQQHRGVSAGLLGGDGALAARVASKDAEVGAAQRALEDSLTPALAQQARWREIGADWRALHADGLSWPLGLNLRKHDEIIARMLLFVSDIADSSALTLDIDLDSYYLIDTLAKLPGFTEQLGQTRATGAGVLAKKTATKEELTNMAELLGRVQITRQLHKANVDKVIGYNPALGEQLGKMDRQFAQDMQGAVETVRRDILDQRFGTEAGAYIVQFTNLIDQNYTIGYDVLAPAVRQRIEARIAGARRSLAISAATSAALVLLFGYLAWGAYLALTGQIGQVLGGLRLLAGDSAVRAAQVERIAAGEIDQEVQASAALELGQLLGLPDEIGALARALHQMGQAQHTLGAGFVRMTRTLRLHRDEERIEDWHKSGINALNVEMRGDRPLAAMSQDVISQLTAHVGGAVGALYLFDPEAQQLTLAAGHALAPGDLQRARIALGEGLAGQAARARKRTVLAPVPHDYLAIASGLGRAAPAAVVAVPLLREDKLLGLFEVASFDGFTERQLAWLEQAAEALAIALDVDQARRRVNELLEQTQSQTEELRVQQEQLQQTNEELEERAQLLEQQRELIRQKNAESEMSSRELQLKADQLERTSAYKSEFLANMSHELRTPLNSMLILSSLLQQNREGQLSPKQVEYAATINGAGKDLLNLINDILDLSKIEAGQLVLQPEEVELAELAAQLEQLFHPLAEHQGLAFQVERGAGLPASVHTDAQRTQQILKNLLSNAFKFTSKGRVTLAIRRAGAGENPLAQAALAFAVCDSGIGIAADKQEQIFHAFQQEDGSTSRKYGGTGLGLSISRQLARKMGGEIVLASAPGAGSTFTLYLPQALAAQPIPAPVPAPAPAPARPAPRVSGAPAVADDRATLEQGARSILIIEDDPAFAGILRDTVRERGFQCLVATDGESGLQLIEQNTPSAIILDVMLPHIDGWGVMRTIKDNPKTRHIPVHFITCLEDRQKALAMGAIGFATKPVSAEQVEQVLAAIGSAIDKVAKRLLVVEDDEAEAKSLAALLETNGLDITIARSGDAALALIADGSFDCMVLDLGLSDMSGFELLDRLKADNALPRMPVIIHSGRELSEADETRLRRYADSIIIKGAKSPDRLLAEVSLFLHLVESSLPQEKQSMIRRGLDKEAMFERRTVLLVDDDIRNVFSLSSVLAEKGMRTVEAANGVEALAQLEAHPEIDIVLMDIMMPEMDGYEAMRRLRKNPRWARLPVIALTAKAMVGDQALCLDAGASDYLSKPVDLDRLFSLMRVWLYQGGAA